MQSLKLLEAFLGEFRDLAPIYGTLTRDYIGAAVVLASVFLMMNTNIAFLSHSLSNDLV